MPKQAEKYEGVQKAYEAEGSSRKYESKQKIEVRRLNKHKKQTEAPETTEGNQASKDQPRRGSLRSTPSKRRSRKKERTLNKK